MRRALLPSWTPPTSFLTCLAASFVVFAAPARAGDWYVDAQAVDCIHSDGSAAAPFCTIGEAAGVAAGSDTIHVAPGTYFELLTLDRSLTLAGTGGAGVTKIDGGGLASVVVITGAAAVEFDGLTITHGKARYGGGVNVGSGCSATLRACVVTANQAEAVDSLGVRVPSSGGGIFASDATVVVAASTFTDNFASEGGGAIRSESGSLTVTDSSFSRNVAGDASGFVGGGGAIDFAVWSVGTMQLERSSFDSNRAGSTSGYGGGAIASFAHPFVADHLLIHHNVSSSQGGGIGAAYGLTLRDSTIENNVATAGGGVYTYNAYDAAIERCTIRGNRASDKFGAWGGGIGGQAVVTDCLIENNTAEAVGTAISRGGGLYLNASSSLVRCVVRGNTATSSVDGGVGGGVAVDFGGTFTFTDCAITGNTATCTATGTAGSGGGMAISSFGPPSHVVTVTRCTIGGNTTGGNDLPGAGDGGGIYVDVSGPVPTLSHVVVAGNTCIRTGGAPDFGGTLQSSGYNLIGDTTGCTVTGDPSGNQLDVDPRFGDPGSGDFTLALDSPALDAGDPAARPTGTDVAGHPRVLDGDLDRVMVLDLGAFEFDHVNFAVSGTATLGSVLTFTTTGTAGLPVFMCIGTANGELRIAPLGSLFIDLSSPWLIVPWGTIPDQQSWTVDPALPVPVILILQPFALEAASRTGNLGNAVRLDFE